MQTPRSTRLRPARFALPTALSLVVLAWPLGASAQDQPTSDSAGSEGQAGDAASSGEDLSPAEVARARYRLARQLYDETLRVLEGPPPPRSGEGAYLTRAYEALHRWAEHARKALADLGGPTDDHPAFLRAHAARMRDGAEQLRRIVEVGGTPYSPIDADIVRLLSLEARSWVLNGEGERGGQQNRDAAGGSTDSEGTSDTDGASRTNTDPDEGR